MSKRIIFKDEGGKIHIVVPAENARYKPVLDEEGKRVYNTKGQVLVEIMPDEEFIPMVINEATLHNHLPYEVIEEEDIESYDREYFDCLEFDPEDRKVKINQSKKQAKVEAKALRDSEKEAKRNGLKSKLKLNDTELDHLISLMKDET